EEGLDVTIIEKQSYLEEIDDLLTGKVDLIGDFVLIDVIKNYSPENQLKVHLATDYSNGADGIVVNRNIKSPKDLKGKKIAVEMGGMGEYLLYDFFSKNKIEFSDVEVVNLNAEEASIAFIENKVDSAVTYEPHLSKAVEKGNGEKIYTSAMSPNLIIDVLVSKTKYSDSNHEKISAFVRSYFKAVDFIEKYPEEAYRIGAKYFKISPSEFKKQYAGVKQLNLEDNLEIMSFGNNTNSIHTSFKFAYDFLKLKNEVVFELDSLDVIDPEIVKELK
ncbi:ABC transporter substrate-binding protein, partial [Patescibacteria group bacterium]|nr:ABC transporter substrate-binding protein [Patescibacteria group bacterium]